jgi:antitoxin (DNA-binding transcriptional repressor) of toxin-antitoxin stability system
MEFVPARDFRLRPGNVWKKLRAAHRLVVTTNGKPVALLTDIEGKDLQEEIQVEAIARGVRAVSRMRAAARRGGASRMSQAQVEKVIAGVRKEKKANGRGR